MRSPSMRASLSVAVLALVTISSAPAASGQGEKGATFEGVVTFQMADGLTLDYAIRQGMVRLDVGGKGSHATVIMDPAAHKTYMLMPAQQMYMEMATPEADGSAESPEDRPKPQKTGKTDIVAGHQCEYWVMRHKDGDTEVCLASDLGGFYGFGNTAGKGGVEWQEQLSKNYFPLKVIGNEDGGRKVVLVATRVEKKALEKAMFAPPEAYRKMTMSMPTPAAPPR
jgi:hypothetical protein